MSRCPFAIWHPLGAPGSPYIGGPFKICHHTTEGSTALGAFSALRRAHAESHFVVDARNIFQLIDTATSSRSLRNAPGGVETNRDSAVQIEMVGFAGRPKDRTTLANVGRLCRWIETTHNIPQVWPNGYPNPPKNGQDPGGHNRNAVNWDTRGGHYGHSQCPENVHWDPAYTRDEVDYLMSIQLGDHVDPDPDTDGEVDQSGVDLVVVHGVAPDVLNLRLGPSSSSRDIGDILEGTVLRRTATSGTWSKVVTPAGYVGWVASKYLAERAK